ncbi:MAG: helix-turn-helix domain-containing protein [Treponema sp.]|jgi:excisionase family DNA binding protein|nr:helix-turn-helix domain-containing protein [Treponema sp.]
MNETQKPLTVRQAAEFLGLKPSYIYNLVFYGKLAAYKPGGKILLFKISDLEAYAFRNKVGGRLGRADSILNARKRTLIRTWETKDRGR